VTLQLDWNGRMGTELDGAALLGRDWFEIRADDISFQGHFGVPLWSASRLPMSGKWTLKYFGRSLQFPSLNLRYSQRWLWRIFWDVTPCSSFEVGRRFGGIYCFYRQGLKVSQAINKQKAGRSCCLPFAGHSLGDPGMEAVHSSETSVNFSRTTRRQIPEDSFQFPFLATISTDKPSINLFTHYIEPLRDCIIVSRVKWP
jgi:hypothetical protein